MGLPVLINTDPSKIPENKLTITSHLVYNAILALDRTLRQKIATQV